MIRQHTKTQHLMTISYILMVAIFGSTIYFVKQQSVNTELRSRATNAVSCDYTIDIQPAETFSCAQQVSLAIAIDRSQNMGEGGSGGKTKIELAKDAVKAFVAAIAESGSRNIKITIVGYGGQGNDRDSILHIGSSDDYDAVIAAVNNISLMHSNGSCVLCGIRIGNSQIENFSGTKAFILVTDGQANRVWNGNTSSEQSQAISEANSGRSKGITYYVIGIGDEGWASSFLDILPNFCTQPAP